MTRPRPRTRSAAGRGILLATVAALATSALPGGSETARAQGDDSAMVRLIQLLIEKGVLTRDQATSLMAQAQNESRTARTAAAKPARAARPAAAAAPAQAAAAEPPPPLVPKGTVRVTYVPQTVRDQIAAQVREQVMGEAEAKGWAAPNSAPEWTRRITLYGDLRLRGEGDLLDKNNANNLIDYNAINTGSPYDTLGTADPLTLNTQENRTRFRLRARIGVKAEIDDWISTDIRLATGNDTSPVSTNQTLGQNSNFGKYAIWLDRAYATLSVPPRAGLGKDVSVRAYVGRMANPFWTTDLLYDDDLNFDGAALSLAGPIGRSGVTLWGTGGAFVAYNTAFNYGISNTFSVNGSGLPSRDKYLFGGQVGADYKPTEEIKTRLAVGLFGYQNIQGQLSAPCTITAAADVCNTDNSRPQFAQFGNTYFPIRDISPNTGLNQNGFVTNPQYFGLASKFNILDVHARVDYTGYEPVPVALEGEFVKNLAFNRNEVLSKNPVNNFTTSTDSQGTFSAGDTGWMVKTVLGKTEIVRLNDWQFVLGYKYLESDAVVDGFTDSDFHLGGTNAKGYFVGGAYGLGRNTFVATRWLSATEVSGPAYRNDVVQVDLNTKF